MQICEGLREVRQNGYLSDEFGFCMAKVFAKIFAGLLVSVGLEIFGRDADIKPFSRTLERWMEANGLGGY